MSHKRFRVKATERAYRKTPLSGVKRKRHVKRK